jgi:hypothetical protein
MCSSRCVNRLAVKRGAESSEADEYDFQSLVFTARRPLHPERFASCVDGVALLWVGLHHCRSQILEEKGIAVDLNRGLVLNDLPVVTSDLHNNHCSGLGLRSRLSVRPKWLGFGSLGLA